MAATRDDFSSKTIEILKQRAAFICSNPICKKMTVAPADSADDKVVYNGRAAHICAASPQGPRYDVTMTPEQRSDIKNAIFLCANCADIIDDNNGADYPAETLREWKSAHETWIKGNLNQTASTSTTEAVRGMIQQMRDEIIGGDSFGTIFPLSIRDGNDDAYILYFQNKGAYPMSDITIRIWNPDDLKAENRPDGRARLEDMKYYQTFDVGNIASGGGKSVGQHFSLTEQEYWKRNFSINAKNGMFSGMLRILKLEGKIATAVRINTVTDGKTPYKILLEEISPELPRNDQGEFLWQ
jgi:hypothetical protein